MAMASSLERYRFTHADLAQVRLDGLPILLAGAYAVALVLAAIPFEPGTEDRYWLAGLLPPLALGLLLLHRAHPRLACLLFVASLYGPWAAEVWLLPESAAVWLAVLVIGSASTLFGARGTFLAAALTSLTILAARGSTGVALGTSILCWVEAGLFWLAARPSTTALEWAWSSYLDAREKQDRLEDRQGELNSVLKTLDLAYRNLEHLNNELSRARRVAEQARKLKGEFAANISHELRTPLNLILGFSEMMVSSPHTYGAALLPPAYQADIDAIYRNAQHLAGLLDDVLDLSQVEAGRMGLVRERTHLGGVVEEADRAVAARLANLGLTLDVEVPTDLPGVSIDRTRIRQVLINLLNNAARFTDRGGVTVSVEARDHELIVSVSDTGVGIPPEDLLHIFDEFYQSGDVSRRRSGGSGLGLAISRHLIELHGGSMWVESDLGHGSTFHFSLPVAENVVTGWTHGEWEIWDRIAASRRQAEPAIAVVTEDEAVARTFRRHLDGYRVLSVPNLQALRKAPDGVVVHGAILASPSPDECWRALCQQSEDGPSLPMAVATIVGDQDLAADLGITAYLAKPVLRDQLGGVLHRLGKSVRTILVVDDNPDMVRLLARTIRSFGRRYQVWQATGGQEALAIMGEQRPDAVLLDLLMPDVDGYTVLKSMRRDDRLRDVQVVAVSAHALSADMPSIGLVGIARRGGFAADQIVRCLKACFDTLQVPPEVHSEPAPPAGPVGSPALAGER